ncbi:MAG: hypothetical protein VB977_09750 [Pseudohongiellaceae bacterium]
MSLQVSQFGLAAEDYAVPRTEWGQPDLQGVWSFSSNISMQRPEEFGERQFLTEDEIAAAHVRRFGLGAAINPTRYG